MKPGVLTYLFYFASLSLSKGLAACTIFLLADAIPPAELGIYSLYGATLVLLQPILTGNKHIGFAKITCDQLPSVANVLVRDLIWNYVKRLPWIIAIAMIVDLFFLQARVITWPLTSIGTFLISALLLVNVNSRCHSQKLKYLTSDLGRNILFVSLVLACSPTNAIEVIALFALAASVVSIMLAPSILRSDVRQLKPNLPNPQELLNEINLISRPTIITAYASFVVVQGGKFTVQFYCGPETLGVYSFFLSIGMIAMLFFDAAVISIQPNYFRNRSSNKARLLLISSTIPIAIGFLAVGPIYSTLPIIEHYLPTAYHGRWQTAVLIFFAFCVRGSYMLLQTWFIDNKKLQVFGHLYIATSLINLAIGVGTIPFLKEIGAALAQVVSFSLLYLGSAIYLLRTSHTPLTETQQLHS